MALDARAHAGLLRPHDARRPRDRRRLRRLRAGRRGARERVLRRERTACVRHARHARGRPLLFVLGLGLGHRRDAGISPAPRPPARPPRSDAAVVHFFFFDLNVRRATRFRLLHVANVLAPAALCTYGPFLIIYVFVYSTSRGLDTTEGLQPEPRRPHLPLRRALVPHADLLPGAERALLVPLLLPAGSACDKSLTPACNTLHLIIFQHALRNKRASTGRCPNVPWSWPALSIDAPRRAAFVFIFCARPADRGTPLVAERQSVLSHTPLLDPYSRGLL